MAGWRWHSERACERANWAPSRFDMQGLSTPDVPAQYIFRTPFSGCAMVLSLHGVARSLVAVVNVVVVGLWFRHHTVWTAYTHP